MLKKNDILAAANAKVAEYMAEGYMISWMNASFGYAFRVDLQKGDAFIRVKVDRFGQEFEGAYLEGLLLSVVSIPEADAFECKDVAPLYVKTFYDLSRYGNNEVFTESLAEKRAAKEKAHSRYQRPAKPVELTPTAEFIRTLKTRKGFTNATRNNVTVYRSRDGYVVKMAGRNGSRGREETIRFPRKK